ncbi:MAG: sensor histidine kinase [Streptosporangiaceae bacterium]
MSEHGSPVCAGHVDASDQGLMGGKLAGFFWIFVWLVFLGYPIADIVRHFHGAAAALPAVALAGFVVLYVAVMWWDGFVAPRDPEWWRVGLLGVLTALTIVLPLAFGGNWLGLFIYASVAGATILPRRYAVAWSGCATACCLAVGFGRGLGPSEIGLLSFLTFMVGLGQVGIRQLLRLIIELRAAREELARLAVSEERLRFARDLHDLVGHSLSLVVLKSELAGRLIDADPARASTQVADIESVARQAMVEVRQAVTGYRERSLAEELDGARAMLRAAAIDVTVRTDGTPLPATTETLLGWAVREGTTNVVRHSRAGRCDIELWADGNTMTLEVRDDGQGPPAGADALATARGTGLRGVAERVEQAGGTLETGPRAGGGYRLTVRVPLDASLAERAPGRALDGEPGLVVEPAR